MTEAALPSEPARPVGGWAAFLLIGALSAAILDGVSVAAPGVHAHGGDIAAIPHETLLALPLTMLMIVVYQVPPGRTMFAALGLSVLGILLVEIPRIAGIL